MDILHDNSHATLLNIYKDYGMPEYVLSSGELTKSASSCLSDRLYADQFNRRYPIDSMANTWLSAAYFAKTAEEDGYRKEIYTVVEDNIKSAAEMYGILDDVNDIMSKIRSVPAEKTAADDDANYGYANGKLYPMFDEEGVKMANAHFEENAFNYPSKMRHEIAKNIFRKSASYGVEVSDRVRKEAGVGLPRKDFMAIQINDRASRCPDEKIACQLLRMNEELLKSEAEDMGDMLSKVAELIEGIDYLTGLDQSYGKTVFAPSDFLYDVSIKEASDLVEDTVELGGTSFSIEKLAELPMSVFTDALGDDFGERIKSASGDVDVEKLSDELNSMIAPDKSALFESIKTHTI